MNTKKYIFGFLLIVLFNQAFGQSVKGYIYDQDNQPVPFANIYFKYQSTGTTSDVEGKYFYQFKDPGVVELIITAVGYKTKSIKIILKDRIEIGQNIWLETDIEELNEVIIKSKGRDPAYGIIQRAIEKRDQWKNQFNSSTSEVYIKAKEVISEKEKRKRERAREEEEIQKQNDRIVQEDVFAKEQSIKQQEINKIAGSMNMFELKLTRHFEYPNNCKEIRTAYKSWGSTYALFYKNTTEADFNFYQNLMSVPKLNDQPLISPLSITSVITYKFKLEETSFEKDRMLFKIKVTPRKSGNATWTGYIWILDKSFCITKVDLHLSKGGLIIYDEFNLKQEYEFNQDSLLLLMKQDFEYESEAGKSDFSGSTKVLFSDYKINPSFEKKYFKNEIAVTTEEAYERDSSYWGSVRPEPLTIEEQRFQYVKDSLYAYTHSEQYLDSLDSVFNKITFLDIAWDGIEFSNRKKMKFVSFSSLTGMIDPFEIGGVRYGPTASFFKKWENQKTLWGYGNFNTSINNPKLKWMVNSRLRYDAKHFGTLHFYAGDQFELIVENDAVSNLIQRSNWMHEIAVSLGTSRELLNGLYASLDFDYTKIMPITDLKFNEYADDWFGGNVPISFDPYFKSVVKTSVNYVPFQKYMTEPKRKVVLGSKWPTFTVYYEKGLKKFLGSNVDYDYLLGQIDHSFKLGTLGTSSYKVILGEFVNNKKMYYTDYKIYPRGDQWFFASLMESMQIQDTTLTVTDMHFRFHYAHHFNGAIINYIPLVKKLRIHVATGFSALWIKESKYQYVELFGGVERTFKIQRSRYRLGIYFVAAESNYSNIKPRIKFALNHYSIRDQSWGY